MSYAIELTDIFHHIDNRCILSNISFKLSKGEVLVLTGPNGSGKTQLLKVIAGLESPSSGKVSILETLIQTSSLGYANIPNNNQLGMVFQTGSLLTHLSVIENLMLPLRNTTLDTESRTRKVRLLMTRLQIDGYENHLPNHLPTGLQRKIEFGRAIINSPEILLFDEIDDSLDKVSRCDMIKLITEQKDKGTTQIIVTHELQHYEHITDKLGVIADGELIYYDMPQKFTDACNDNAVLDYLKMKYL